MIQISDITKVGVEDEIGIANIGELSNSTLEASTKLLAILNTMLDNTVSSNGTISIADLKDITAMIKDVSAQIDKLGKQSVGGKSSGLEMFLNRLKR